MNSQAPITNKFEIRHGSSVSVCNAPDEILTRIKLIPEIFVETHLDGLFDVVILFLTSREHVEGYFPRAAKSLRQKGFIWTLFPNATKPMTNSITTGVGALPPVSSLSKLNA